MTKLTTSSLLLTSPDTLSRPTFCPSRQNLSNLSTVRRRWQHSLFHILSNPLSLDCAWDLLPPIALMHMSTMLPTVLFRLAYFSISASSWTSKIGQSGLAFAPSFSMSDAYCSVLFTLHRAWNLLPPSYWCPPCSIQCYFVWLSA